MGNCVSSSKGAAAAKVVGSQEQRKAPAARQNHEDVFGGAAATDSHSERAGSQPPAMGRCTSQAGGTGTVDEILFGPAPVTATLAMKGTILMSSRAWYFDAQLQTTGPMAGEAPRRFQFEGEEMPEASYGQQVSVYGTFSARADGRHTISDFRVDYGQTREV